jgi:hypothetical protein
VAFVIVITFWMSAVLDSVGSCVNTSRNQNCTAVGPCCFVCRMHSDETSACFYGQPMPEL